MMNARELLLAYTANIADPEVASSLFAEDGVLELPYLESIGLPTRTVGPEAIREFMTGLLLRESLDLVRAARAMLPNGVADIPA
ncbi:hypothetical protein OG258_53290 [Streptomyces mirabilis]|uniref:hypothetical protein n=1 Tax=Streptomyces mirabilis TaxID=68239 RepID=UPI002E2E6641|nr:hypothetical protein [Streptomyces mirabilis]